MADTPLPPADTAPILAQLTTAPGFERLRELASDGVDEAMLAAILEEAAKFAAGRLAPFNVDADRVGCRIEGGRVKTAPGHKAAWDAYREAGWMGLDQGEEIGGQGLPVCVLAACTEVFDRSCVAFGMAPTGQRAACRLLAAHAEESIKAEWLPRLVSGEWAATIVISEPEAGSDVGRIRSMAKPLDDGEWEITGEKIWISYGDNDLTARIGHCLLARTPDAAPGAGGLSLFLVPSVLDDGTRNAIAVRRLEEKMGLHGSPTCALGFEGARGRLIGQVGRGLAALFTMITTMRLMVAVQGLAIASGATDVAFAYAAERRQGGRPDAPATPIIEHADVQRMLLGMASRVAALRGVILAAAVAADRSRLESDPAVREEQAALAGWLLPIAKTFGGEIAFDTASDAIQVLGGAGYVRDWPVEQMLRDCRVFTVFEGTSGIQALDLLQRRLRGRDGGAGFKAFMALARADTAGSDEQAGVLGRVLDLLDDAAAKLADPASGDAGAYAFLKLAALAATGWSALRLTRQADAKLRAAGAYWLADLEGRAALEHGRALAEAERLKLFEAVRPAV